MQLFTPIPSKVLYERLQELVGKLGWFSLDYNVYTTISEGRKELHCCGCWQSTSDDFQLSVFSRLNYMYSADEIATIDSWFQELYALVTSKDIPIQIGPVSFNFNDATCIDRLALTLAPLLSSSLFKSEESREQFLGDHPEVECSGSMFIPSRYFVKDYELLRDDDTP